MRRILTLVAVMALIAMLPATASAAKATKVTINQVNLNCDGIAPTAGVGFAFFGASFSDVDGGDAFLDAWSSAEPDEQADVTRDYEIPATVSWDGATLGGSFAVIDDTGAPLGDATFSAAMTPVGDPYPIDDSFRDGNHQQRYTGTGQALQPGGSLTLPGGATFDLAGCVADMASISVFATNPSSVVFSFAEHSVGCDLEDAAGDTGYLYVGFGDEETFVDAGLFPADGSPAIFAGALLPPTSGTIDTDLDTWFDDGTPAGVAASLAMTATATRERFEVIFESSRGHRVTRGQLLDIEGSLTIGEVTFDVGGCVGFDGTSKELHTSAKGPKPGGKVPANDLPANARWVTVGSSANLQTKGASPDREAPFPCLTEVGEDGSIFEVPVGHTVWYRIVGTGGTVTFDTAGSDFDTVAAAYTGSVGALVPIEDEGACVDDVPTVPFGRTLQAAISFATQVGTTYYVQIGGFPDDPPYGGLRVAVR
jgi:hypothetical protein